MIDTSGLSREQKAFLESHPDFLKGLEADIPRQAAGVEKRRLKMRKGKAKWQRELDETMEKAESLRRQYDPILRELGEKYAEKLPKLEGSSGLVCPQCRDVNHKNRMNGKPWCMKCNVPLVEKEKAAKWLKERIKTVHPKIPSELRGLPKEDE